MDRLYNRNKNRKKNTETIFLKTQTQSNTKNEKSEINKSILKERLKRWFSFKKQPPRRKN